MNLFVVITNRLIYLVIKPLLAAVMLADDVHSWEKNEYLAKKWSFEAKCEILRTISQKGMLSANIPASQMGGNIFYNPPINFYIMQKLLVKK